MLQMNLQIQESGLTSEVQRQVRQFGGLRRARLSGVTARAMGINCGGTGALCSDVWTPSAHVR